MTILLGTLLSGFLATQSPPPAEERVPPVTKQEPKQEPAPKPAPKQEPKPKQEPQGSEKPAGQESKKPDVTEIDLPKNQPLPQSADPEDLRAMRSAQDMVDAERRLRARIKSGKIKDIDQLLSFEEISSWPYEMGLKGMPKPILELDDRQVVMIGFMLPIDEVEDIKEFLLVQSLWACCFGTPPDINGIVRVVMKGDSRTDYQFDPIMVTGRFEVEETTEDGYCIDIFQLHADRVQLLK